VLIKWHIYNGSLSQIIRSSLGSSTQGHHQAERLTKGVYQHHKFVMMAIFVCYGFE